MFCEEIRIKHGIFNILLMKDFYNSKSMFMPPPLETNAVTVVIEVSKKDSNHEKQSSTKYQKTSGKRFQRKPGHSISYKTACAPRSPGACALADQSAARLTTLWILGYSQGVIRRFRTGCTDAHSDLYSLGAYAILWDVVPGSNN